MSETETDLEKLCEEYGHPMNAAAAMAGKVICNAAVEKWCAHYGPCVHKQPHKKTKRCEQERCNGVLVKCIPVEETP